jgi:hypothetical protein
MLALLAPVPAVHLPDAFRVQNADGIVAFGTGAESGKSGGEWSFTFFSKAELKEGEGSLPVLIYGSETDLKPPNPYFHAGHVTALAIYQRVRHARGGEHPIPEYRPEGARLTDKKWVFFWEVSHLKVLDEHQHIKLKDLYLPGKGKLKKYSGIAPRGPRLVVVPDKLTSTVRNNLDLN